MKPQLFLRLALGTAFAFLQQATAQTIEVTSIGVGIGTATPSFKFEVLDSAASSGIISRWTRNSKSFEIYTGSTVDLQLGTPTNSSLGFYTNNNNPLLTLSTGQNVGIGTTSPYSKLTVSRPVTNSISFEDESNTAGLTVSGSDAFVRLQFGVGGNTIGPYGSWIQSSFDNSPGGTGSSGAEPLMLNPLGGNVGIGTTSPGAKLDVQGDATFTSGATFGFTVNIGTNSGLIVGAAAKATAPSGGKGSIQIFSNDAANPLQGWLSLVTDGTANNRRLSLGVIEQNVSWRNITLAEFGGNVGIGTASPGYKLEVAGSVRATSFVANGNTYADFVFKPGYPLRSLSEVEAAIKAHGHLPDIPSEAEAKARGIDLAAMQVKLLQKVEEMTLYLVAHDKELKQLRAENAALRDEFSAREKR